MEGEGGAPGIEESGKAQEKNPMWVEEEKEGEAGIDERAVGALSSITAEGGCGTRWLAEWGAILIEDLAKGGAGDLASAAAVGSMMMIAAVMILGKFG